MVSAQDIFPTGEGHNLNVEYIVAQNKQTNSKKSNYLIFAGVFVIVLVISIIVIQVSAEKPNIQKKKTKKIQKLPHLIL